MLIGSSGECFTKTKIDFKLDLTMAVLFMPLVALTVMIFTGR